MLEEETDARHASNYQEMKFNRERKYRNTIPHAYQYEVSASPNYHQPPPPPPTPKQVLMTRPKHNPKKKVNPTKGNKRFVKDIPAKKATSDSESDCQFFHANVESEIESQFDDDEENFTTRTIQEMESNMNATTNRYFRKIKSQLFDTCSKLKACPKPQPNLNKSKTYGKKFDTKASGDSNNCNQQKQRGCLESDIVIGKFQKVKAECYRKIEENLKILQQIDSASEKLYKNYLGKN